MSKSNKRAKERLIELYGAECFIDKLHLRPDTERKYTGKKQYERMKQLTYHHILERRNGGQATLENGAILSAENHIWFNKQNPQAQAEMNRQFQEYKKCKVVLVDELNLGMEVKATEISFSDEIRQPKERFNRAKVKREFQKRVDEEMEEYR